MVVPSSAGDESVIARMIEMELEGSTVLVGRFVVVHMD